MLNKPAFPQSVIDAYAKAGSWPQRDIYAFLSDAAENQPNKTLIVDRFGRLSYAEALAQTDALAGNLQSLGVGRGDRVAVQLPNWRYFPLMEYALARLGAVIVPLPPIYRQRELRLMLGLAEPVMAICPDSFRGFDHAGMFHDLQKEIPSLRHLAVIGETRPDGALDFFDLLRPNKADLPPPLDPNIVTEIAFTSGTTGEPKGVMHTANTNFCPLINLIEDQKLGADTVVLMASTFGHQTGFAYGGQLPVIVGGTVVLMERWDAKQGAALIDQENVTWMMGATPFLQDLTDAVESGAGHCRSLRIFLCSGAPIPRSLLMRAQKVLGAHVVSGWGMTEVGLTTLSRLDDPAEKIFGSDGRPLRGMQIRVVDADDKPLPDGEEGELQCRGPTLFAGYWLRPDVTAASFADGHNAGDGGWLRTGDRARRDVDGYIRITGRSKDIIVRGGENIPVVEVEDLLHKHPRVQVAAIVAIPDPRLQERACAVIVTRDGGSFDMAQMLAFLEREHLAKQYFPEHLVVMDAMPMTPSGKVQKYILRKKVLEIIGVSDVA
ncbi:AMP-binding protein [Ferrovibrio sp.]|uniref:AMP-binding protein n=1 Tax=Ferrovibrio sp. TaxID=1917215 RepID=UPI0035B28B43